MRKLMVALAFCVLTLLPARGKSSDHSSGHSRSSLKCSSCTRNSNGKIARSSKTKHQFEKYHPCPSTGQTTGGRPGYVVDHVVPLKQGGADSPSNMQWQTKANAKLKDRIE